MTLKSSRSGPSPTVDGQATTPGTGMDISMELDDPDLDAAIQQALAATEKRAAEQARKRRRPPDLPDFDPSVLGEDPDRSMHIVVDDLDALDDGFDFLGGAEAEEDGTDDEFDFLSLTDQPGAPKAGFDDLHRELEEAIDDDEEADEGDLQAEMEKLLAESFGVQGVSDDDADLAFPNFDDDDDDEHILAEDDEDDDDEVFAAGDDGAAARPVDFREEVEALRSQVVELSRALSMRDLELRTAEDRVDGLEQQVVAAARQSAGVSREFESFRKRAERDREELQKFAGEKVLKEFLGVFDNLERALSHAGHERGGPLGQGVEMTLGQFMVALRRCGAERVPASPGTEFDPQFHEAVGQEHSDEVASGRICHEMQAGFTLHTRLLRASMVSVSRGPLQPPPSADPADSDATIPDEDEVTAPPEGTDRAPEGTDGAPGGDAAAEAAPAKKPRAKKKSGKSGKGSRKAASTDEHPVDEAGAATDEPEGPEADPESD